MSSFIFFLSFSGLIKYVSERIPVSIVFIISCTLCYKACYMKITYKLTTQLAFSSCKCFVVKHLYTTCFICAYVCWCLISFPFFFFCVCVCVCVCVCEQVWLCIFPEGTRFTSKNLSASQSFARDNS